MLSIKNLTLGYKESRILIDNLSLTAPDGDLIALVGRNGAGKSTLLRSLAGLVPPLSGDIEIDGHNIKSYSPAEIAELISFVSTEPVAVNHLSVFDVVALGRSPYTNWIGSLSESDREIVAESLDMVGMEHFAEKTIDRLSDGERQRVMIARALAQDTPIILLDEPTAFLDLPNRYEIALLLGSLARKFSKTVIFSTHDLSIGIRLCDAMWVVGPDAVHSGSPEDLMLNGVINSIFDGSSVEFDAHIGDVRLTNQPIGDMRIEADNRQRTVLRRLVERCGFRVNDNASQTLKSHNGEYSIGSERFRTLYDVAKFLNK